MFPAVVNVLQLGGSGLLFLVNERTGKCAHCSIIESHMVFDIKALRTNRWSHEVLPLFFSLDNMMTNFNKFEDGTSLKQLD